MNRTCLLRVGALAVATLAVASGCARPPAASSCDRAAGPRPEATSTTELTSATAGGPSAPRVGKAQRASDAGEPDTLAPLGEEKRDEPKRPERTDVRRGGFGEWK